MRTGCRKSAPSWCWSIGTTTTGVPETVPQKAGYRDPDAIRGGTWEQLERILQRAGYFRSGLRKNELARAVSAHMQPERNTSKSFQAFRSALQLAEEWQ